MEEEGERGRRVVGGLYAVWEGGREAYVVWVLHEGLWGHGRRVRRREGGDGGGGTGTEGRKGILKGRGRG